MTLKEVFLFFALATVAMASFNFERNLRGAAATCAPQASSPSCSGCGCCTSPSAQCLCNPSWAVACTSASEDVCAAAGGQYCTPGPTPSPTPAPSPGPGPVVTDYMGQFMIPRWNTWKYKGSAGSIGVCFGGGSDIGANTAAGCNPGGPLYQTTVDLTKSGGDKYYDFGGGEAKERQWFTESKLSQLNDYMTTLSGYYQGILYDIETFEQSFDVDSMYKAFADSFKSAKAKGLKVAVSTSYTAPYNAYHSADYMRLTDALWTKILGNTDIDIFAPQFYGRIGEHASIIPTDGSSVSFSTWTTSIHGAGKIVPVLKAWSQEFFETQVQEMEAKCKNQIGESFCQGGYILWGST